jgi:hypothetical protein
MTKTLPECSMAPIGQVQEPRLAGNAGPVLAIGMEGRLKNTFASIKAFSETDFKARRRFTFRVDLMVSLLPIRMRSMPTCWNF